jgi:hypothetical protein
MWALRAQVIMIVRGAQRQLSFLHVYHHVGTFLVWRFNVAYYPGGVRPPTSLFLTLRIRSFSLFSACADGVVSTSRHATSRRRPTRRRCSIRSCTW